MRIGTRSYTLASRTISSGEATSTRWASEAFVHQYNAHKLIYFETHPDPDSAIAREKQLKSWSRAKKEALITRSNPDWKDLFTEMYAVRPNDISR